MPRLRRGIGGYRRDSPVAGSSSAARTTETPLVSSGVVSNKNEVNAVGGKKGGRKKLVVSENEKEAEKTPMPETVKSSPAAGASGGKKEVKKTRTEFAERLQWKMKHLRMPTTSTPKRDLRSKKVTKYDIETAFGFDESSEAVADYSTLLSPIAHSSPKGALIPPVWKVHPLSQRNADCALPEVKRTRAKPKVAKSSKKATSPTVTVSPPASSTRSFKKTTVTIRSPASSTTSSKKATSSTAAILLPEPVSSTKSSKKTTSSTVAIPPPAPASSSKSSKKTTSSTVTIPPPATSAKASKKATPSTVAIPSPASSTKSTEAPQLIVKKQNRFFKNKQAPSTDKDNNGSSPFSQLLDRMHQADNEPAQRDPDELHVDPKKIVRTYASRKRAVCSEERDPETEYDFIPKPTVDEEEEEVIVVSSNAMIKSKKTKSRKKVAKAKKLKDDEDLDDDMRKWLEEKNREFKDIEKTKLVIEQSFSD